MVLTAPGKGDSSSDLNIVFAKLLYATIFVILPSFALSIAGKYLGGKR